MNRFPGPDHTPIPTHLISAKESWTSTCKTDSERCGCVQSFSALRSKIGWVSMRPEAFKYAKLSKNQLSTNGPQNLNVRFEPICVLVCDFQSKHWKGISSPPAVSRLFRWEHWDSKLELINHACTSQISFISNLPSAKLPLPLRRWVKQSCQIFSVQVLGFQEERYRRAGSRYMRCGWLSHPGVPDEPIFDWQLSRS